MRKPEILLAEDNLGDVLLIRRALAVHGIPHMLHVASDGEKAIEIVAQVGHPGGPPCLDLLLLDLNLPKADGQQILTELRNNPACSGTPVIVVSSSNTVRDRTRLDELGISGYFQKPSDLDEFMRLGAVVKEVLSGHSE